MNKLYSIASGLALACGLLAAPAPATAQKVIYPEGAPETFLIKTEVPVRPAGQEDMLLFRAPKLETVRVGFIGLGMRGPGAVDRISQIKGTKVVALADLYQERTAYCNKILSKNGRPSAAEYYGSEDSWKKLVERPDIDLVYIATNWQTHVEMALYAMEHGKHVAVEVPAAFSMEDIWALINTSERTRKHCMMLENCVYDFFEMTTLNMAQQGLFGEVMYAEGGYLHNLEPFWKYYEGNWRMDYNQKHRGDIYPTHGMGPAAQVLNIHRGDKMNVLVSMDSKPVSIPNYLRANGQEDKDFQNGEHTMTFIRTEKGKTIYINHDVATPHPYDRLYLVQGTKGKAQKYPAEHFSFVSDELLKDGTMPDHENLNMEEWLSPEQQKALIEKYKHPITRELEEVAKKIGGHGGMDFIMDYRLIYCLQNGLPLDQDVYDLAEWCCLVPLSKISIEHGFAPVEVPDFTRGGWNKTQGYHHFVAGE